MTVSRPEAAGKAITFAIDTAALSYDTPSGKDANPDRNIPEEVMKAAKTTADAIAAVIDAIYAVPRELRGVPDMEVMKERRSASLEDWKREMLRRMSDNFHAILNTS